MHQALPWFQELKETSARSEQLTLCCCTSEVTGALPFAGGAYGLSRCTLGFFPGYLIGCCEALEYIAYVATSVVAFAEMIVQAVPSLEGMEPAIALALAFYVSALCVHLRGDCLLWRFVLLLGAVSLAIALLFCFGSLPYVNFTKYADDPSMHVVHGVSGFLKAFPLASWFFVGVEALSLASDHVESPKTAIPFAQIACVLTLCVTGAAVFFATVSLPPGIAHLPSELVPFNNCFELLFQLPHNTVTILLLPATYATAFGFMWCYGKLIAAMAESHLLPGCLSRTKAVGMGFGSLLSYAICLVVHFVGGLESCLFTICITCAFLSYTGQCIGYISLKINYRKITRSSFRNPFGIAGAVYSMSIWLMGLVAIVGFQGNGGIEIAVFGAVVALLTIYYFGYAKKRQVFSVEENRILLVAHVVEFNERRRAAAARSKHSSGLPWGWLSNKSTAAKDHADERTSSGTQTTGRSSKKPDKYASRNTGARVASSD
ncbi:hypothetical protein FI667_g6774, partial [Globisporangium splendens]